MGLFSKTEYETLLMDYRFFETDGLPCIEAYGDVFGQIRYCNAGYAIKTSAYSMWTDGRYEKMAEDLRQCQRYRKIEVMIKIRKSIPVDFRIDLERLADTIGNPDIVNLELAGWGFNTEPEKTDL